MRLDHLLSSFRILLFTSLMPTLSPPHSAGDFALLFALAQRTQLLCKLQSTVAAQYNQLMTTSTSTAFEQAQQDVQNLSSKPGNDVMLKLYGFYKQGTQGDAAGERPGGFNFVAAAKHDAWKALAGRSQAEAQAEYVALVEHLKGQN